ncbi:mandelate racemase/muconate lactonizing enzyme family protein [Halococcus thailandensis]|uniref:o-succinylbenzoate synthase n=1 Tax=Halococcus thailandensis JCM 13552 TaxID=1227457 RepID=M0N1V8_9EURY|nr:o-succinylbenzoate synthase [Halococcus thailandensis]EMA51861.1 chloromuconate cycloisomerase [Halococcus thailandensis JCM 13552]
MKIEPFSLALASPLSTARGTIDTREGFLVTIDHEGTRGIGEATPLPGWSESLDECRTALDRADDIDDWSAALDTLDGTPAARHGFALALADARSRAADLPLYRHLGGDPTDDLPVNATIGDGSIDETVAAATAAVEQGFEALKIKVGARAVAEDVERVATVRKAVGNDIELRADANGAWDREAARIALDGFADTGLAYVEQPLPADDLASHADLRGRLPIALDESLATHSVERVLAADAADVLIVKPMALGGPDRARSAVLAAHEAGCEAVLTTTIDGALARAGAVHVAASLPDPPAAGLATADRLAENLVQDPAPIDDGHARVPQEPGSAPLEDG